VRVLAGGLLAGGLLAAGVPGVAAAQAQAGGTPAWLRARLDGRLDPRLRVSVEKVIDSALAAGVPAEPLVDKALEGASKHAPGEAILRAVRTLAGDLARARLAGAVGVLTDLVARGVPVNDASGSVLALSRLGLADEQLVAFRRDVERDIGLGAPPGTAALLQTNTFRVNASIGGESGGPVRTRTEGRPRVRP
jgi:hypothetical protein